jgi:DNA-directed RNA polymerase specialized sigma24 family protein
LAPRYREALALEADGVDPSEIAAAVEVPVESLGSFLELAHAKQSAEGDH